MHMPTNSIIGIETPFVGIDHLIVIIVDLTVGRANIGFHCLLYRLFKIIDFILLFSSGVLANVSYWLFDWP